MSTVKADNFTWKTGQATGQTGTNVTGDQIVYGVAKSWVQFTCVSGSLVTSASFNVSSVTRNTTGQFYIDFSTAMRDANYSAVTSGYNSTSAASSGFTNGAYILAGYAFTSSRSYFNSNSGANAYADLGQYSLSVNR